MRGEPNRMHPKTGLSASVQPAKLGTPTLLHPEALREAHDSPLGGHFGTQRTAAPVQREFYWKGLAQDFQRYVRGCATWHRAKPSNERPFGILQPLEIPQRRWQRINVNFTMKLPETVSGELPIYGGNDTIMTFIDALTKRAHWVVTSEKDLMAEHFAEVFMNSYFRLRAESSGLARFRI